MEEVPVAHPTCRVLSLDGGGAKGFYTLGVLHELEALVGKRMFEAFDLIYGTSTGAIIASLLALGRSVGEVHQLYRENVPAVMKARSKGAKTEALEKLASEVYGDASFTALRTGIGIVAARDATEVPMIFKNDVNRSFSRSKTFVPGFGVSLRDAVVASCSAYPFFEKKITTSLGEELLLLDGGYCANNPTLFAITDALKMGLRHDIRVVSLGVGHYPEPRRWGLGKFKREFFLSKLLQTTLNLNTNSMEQLRNLLFLDIPTVRISNAYTEPHMATDLMEHDLKKLSMLHSRGRESFGRRENELQTLLA